jgi:chromosome segregation protein
MERERQRAADAQAALARLNEEESRLRDETTANDTRRAGVEPRVAEAHAALTVCEASFDELTGALADLSARRGTLEQAAREQSDRIDRLSREIAAVKADLGLLTAGEGADVPMLAAAAETSKAAAAEAEADALRAEAAHSAARQGLDRARGPLAEAERRAQRLETEARTLAKLLHVGTKTLWPAVIENLTVEKGYEAALGAALGDDLEAPIDASAPMRWAGAAIDPSDPALPEGIDALADHVEAPPELARRLAQIGVIERDDAARLTAAIKPGQRLVSREGDLWRWDGFSVAANAPTGAARRLAGKNRLAEIEAELETVRRDVMTKRQAVTDAEAEAAASADTETTTRGRWRSLQHAAQSARERHAEAEREASRTAARVSALGEAVTRLTASLGEASAARSEANAALGILPPAAELEGKLAALRSEIEGRRARLAEVRAEAQALAREAEIAARRLANIAGERQAWSGRNDSAVSQLETLEGRIAEAAAERASLEDAPRLFEEQRRGLIGEIETAETERRAAADRLAHGENALAEADRAARSALEAVGTAREQSARAEERFAGGRRRLEDVAHEIRDMLEAEPAEVANLAGIDPENALPDVLEIEANLERLRRDRERLGAVNLRAEEELREVEAQHGSLTTDRDDLIEAIKRLRHGIGNLNREARERLLASFEVVNKHFGHLFAQLFGGGTAELQLIESEDPLEAGLEIIAKPPGKKPATLSLLSGGEQALTALALIFAVFLTNPAPICVLDEVDAPLDDHNIERFCDLLDEMTRSTDTRFVIITHNPITMARMNRLFGITMAEHGVSQLVSVDLEDAVKLREAV